MVERTAGSPFWFGFRFFYNSLAGLVFGLKKVRLAAALMVAVIYILSAELVFAARVPTVVADITEDEVTYTDTLYVAGKLTVSGANAVFSATSIVGRYGYFYVSSAGDWFYAATNSQKVIQRQGDGDILRDLFKIDSEAGDNFTVRVNIHGVNDIAVISGVDTGSVSEDDDSLFASVLVASGKLDVVDVERSQAAFVGMNQSGRYGYFYLDVEGTWFYLAQNSQLAIQELGDGDVLKDEFTVKSLDGTSHAVVIDIRGVNDVAQVSGVDTARLVEDGDNIVADLLLVTGKLDVVDNDLGQSVFVGKNYTGLYGYLYFDDAGYWTYLAQNSQPVIQGLYNGEALTETFVVKTFDGTQHEITVVIDGVDDVPVVATIDLSWFTVATREDGSIMPLSEIAGYRIYIGFRQGDYIYDFEVLGNAVESFRLSGVPANTYYLVMTAFDKDGRESLYSDERTLILQ